jgi:Fe-S-cluster containining protein
MVQLTVAGRPLGMRVQVPTAPLAPEALLPMYRGLIDRLAAMSETATAAAGKPLSCRRGCAACCRQLVPVSALEARELAKLVERLPEPRRSLVKQRFADARRRLEAEAPQILERLLHPNDFPDSEPLAFAREYFRLQITCPFLEDEACTIYADRPLACRQYMVVSDPGHCATLSDDVQALDPIGGPATPWVPTWERTPAGRPVELVALIRALDFVAAHPQDPPPRPGLDLLGEFITRMQQRGKWGKES